MSAIFKNKKKDTENSLKLSAYERENRRLNRQLTTYQEAFHKLTRYNDSSDDIIYNRYVNKHFWVVSVKQEFSRLSRRPTLKFELRDMCDRKAVDYFQGQLWLDILYSGDGKIKGFWIAEFRTKIQNKGYGSMLLGETLWYIVRNYGTNVKLKGWLSPVDEIDSENKGRRNHVYQKFGFDIDGEYVSLKGISLDKLIEARLKWNNRNSS